MLDVSAMRIVAHIMSLGILVAMGIIAYIARDVPISLKYWKWAVLSVTFYSLWFLGLIISVGSAPWIERKYIVSSLMFVEFVGAVLGWSWLCLTFKASFRITFDMKRNRAEGVL